MKKQKKSKAIIAIHGIKTNSLNWTDVFKAYIINDKRFDDRDFIEINWGYLPALFTMIPPLMYWKYHYVKKRIVEACKDYEQVDIIAHSMGTRYSYYAIKSEKLPVRKLIMFSGVVKVNERVDHALEASLGQLINYYSPYDEVARFNPFGHCGYAGFEWKHKRLLQKSFYVEHSEWFSDKPPDFYKLWMDDLANG